MAQTIAQKILRNHALKEVAEVKPGEFIRARVDLTLLNDVNGPMAFRHFEKMGGTTVASPDKLALVCDHFAPAPGSRSPPVACEIHWWSCISPGIGRRWERSSTSWSGSSSWAV